jgi:hypothetical protein
MWSYQDPTSQNSLALEYIFFIINLVCYPISILVYILCLKYCDANNFKEFDDLTTRAFSTPAGLMLGAGSFCYLEYRNVMGVEEPEFTSFLAVLFWIRLWWVPTTCFLAAIIYCLIGCKCIKLDNNGTRVFRP